MPVSAPSALEAVLAPGGSLERALPGYEPRPDQLRMAVAVADALARRRYLVAEAGTGTGKTLAYLLPAVQSGRRVVISTATRTLQEQIWFRDIPLLRDRCGVEISAAYLKGRANYYCIARGEEFERHPTFPPGRRRRSGRASGSGRAAPTPATAQRSTCPIPTWPGRTSRPPARPASERSARPGRTASCSRPGPAPPAPTWCS
jgi:ATP-dependent DNA helicase DinG